eukprot:CAMPEP_0178407340 /NCGR_PEP_ID=MMETSP0689_2-20121128/19379_1 /TAXON_ID=160604 /ORGANISM="Amphidinium massartii, Strain CS-259" /LENGTH=1574 /DNA_ID=CAMNT_0020028413 /DNA_START=26 /DNA_END=4746 /DNA_ORIENTATION=+
MAESEEVATAAQGSFVDFPLKDVPPEGIDWANRWAELEKATEVAEGERDNLKEEVNQLRKQRYDQATAISPQQAVADSEELKEARREIEELRQKCERHLAEKVDERSRSGTLSDKLQRLQVELTEKNQAILAKDHELSQLKSELEPIRSNRDSLEREKEEAGKRIQQLSDDLSEAEADRNRIFREKSDEIRRLQQDLDQVKSEAQFQRSVADESREFQDKARADIKEAQEELRRKADFYAENRADLEKKLELKGEQLKRAEDLRQAAQQKQEEAVNSWQAAVIAKEEAERAASSAKEHAAELERSLAKNEELLRRQVPGADQDAPPEGFPSVAELVHEVTKSREELVRLKQEKQHLQETLAEVDREVRARYPALMQQRMDLERLKTVSTELTKQNEGLLEQVRMLESQKKESDLRAMQAQRSVEILENHARDMGKQLAGVVYENRRLTGRTRPGVAPPGETIKDVQDLVDQNEALRKTVALLRKESETAAQKELQSLRVEHEKLTIDHNKMTEESNEKIEVLQKMEERLTRERDEARQALREAKQKAEAVAAKPVESVSAGGSSAPTETLQALREEFSKVNNTLQLESQKLRESERALRGEVSTLKAALDFEKSRRQDEEVHGNQLSGRLEEQKARFETLEKRFGSVEEQLRREEESNRALDASLKQATRDKSHLTMEVKLANTKAKDLEDKVNQLLAERASSKGLEIELQASLVSQREAYKDMKSTLEGAYKREEQLLKEQVQLAQERQKDLQHTVEELTKVRNDYQAEATTARERAKELEAQNAKLNTDLVQKTVELDELRASGKAKARRGADVVAEAEAQIGRSQASRGESADVEKLKAELRRLQEREKEHERNSSMWKGILQKHEDDLKSGETEKEELRKEMVQLQEKQEKHEAELLEGRDREGKLQQELNELTKEASEVRTKLDKKEAELESARMEGESKVKEARSQLEAMEKERAGARGDNDDWERKYKDAIQAHSQDIEKATKLGQKYETLEEELRSLKQSNLQLAADNDRLKLEQGSTFKDLQKKLDQAEEHHTILKEELKMYQEHFKTLSSKMDAKELQAELKARKEVGEMKQAELALEKDRLERESRSLKAEVSELQRRLTEEQQQVQKLDQEMKRDIKMRADLASLPYLKQENTRLQADLQGKHKKYEELETKLKEVEPQRKSAEKEVQDLKNRLELEKKTRLDQSAKIEELHRQVKLLQAPKSSPAAKASSPSAQAAKPAAGGAQTAKAGSTPAQAAKAGSQAAKAPTGAAKGSSAVPAAAPQKAGGASPAAAAAAGKAVAASTPLQAAKAVSSATAPPKATSAASTAASAAPAAAPDSAKAPPPSAPDAAPAAGAASPAVTPAAALPPATKPAQAASQTPAGAAATAVTGSAAAAAPAAPAPAGSPPAKPAPAAAPAAAAPVADPGLSAPSSTSSGSLASPAAAVATPAGGQAAKAPPPTLPLQPRADVKDTAEVILDDDEMPDAQHSGSAQKRKAPVGGSEPSEKMQRTSSTGSSTPAAFKAAPDAPKAADASSSSAPSAGLGTAQGNASQQSAPPSVPAKDPPQPKKSQPPGVAALKRS